MAVQFYQELLYDLYFRFVRVWTNDIFTSNLKAIFHSHFLFKSFNNNSSDVAIAMVEHYITLKLFVPPNSCFFFQVHPRGGGKSCPKKLSKHQKCKIVCKTHIHKNHLQNDDIHCLKTDWSPWTDCDSSCNNKYQYRFREVLQRFSASRIECVDDMEQRECICYWSFLVNLP